MSRSYIHNKEAGFVSLFSTIFFMLLITVITIGFLRIMTLEQRQAIDNDLTASAITAAESGVEDGKRAILRYYQLPDGNALKNELRNAFNSGECDALTSSATIRSALGLSATGNVITNEDLNQYYTCLTVDLSSPDYLSQASGGTSQIVPLKTANPGGFDQVKISWHLISEVVGSDGDGVPTAYAPGPLLSPVVNAGNPFDSWTSLGYPAYMRAQLFGYPNGTFDRDDLQERNRMALLVPGTTGTDESSSVSFSATDPNPGKFGDTELSPVMVRCRPNPAASIGGYACTAVLDLPNDPGLRGNNNNYFLRVTPLYGQSHFRVALMDDGSEVALDGVQPVIDVTGRAADVFRRIQARVLINPTSNIPEYVVESAEDICKIMQVSTDPGDYLPNDCP